MALLPAVVFAVVAVLSAPAAAQDQQTFILSTVQPSSPTAAAPQHPAVASLGPDDNSPGTEAEWKLLAMGVDENLGIAFKDIEGALPGRFIPGTEVWALRRLEDGHFLRIRCSRKGAAPALCPEKRGALETRVLKVCLLRSMRRGKTQGGLYDESTYETTAEGDRYVASLERRFPDLWRRLFALVKKKMAPSL